MNMLMSYKKQWTVLVHGSDREVRRGDGDRYSILIGQTGRTPVECHQHAPTGGQLTGDNSAAWEKHATHCRK
jgi:hypothetical protein